MYLLSASVPDGNEHYDLHERVVVCIQRYFYGWQSEIWERCFKLSN